jgi:PhnB protein
MSKSVRPVPEGHHTVSPYLIVNDAAAALDFYGKAFGAVELMRHKDPSGKVGHAEIMIGDSVIMLADEFPDFGARSPRHYGGTPVSIHLYVEDVDKLASQAIAAGAKVVRPVQDQFYGDRSGTFEDSFGHQWHVSTHIEDVPPEELSRRAAAQKAH